MGRKIIFALMILGWLLLVFLVITVSIYHFDYNPTFPYVPSLAREHGHRIRTTFAQFDGVHYLTIIKQGYVGTGLIQAFFPVYPLLIKYLSAGFIDAVIAGMIISASCFILAIIVLERVQKNEWSRVSFIKLLGVVLMFPVSWYWISLYTEALFSLLSISCYYLIRTNRWGLASVIAAFASATRVTGIVWWIIILFEYWRKNRQIKLKNWWIIGLPPLGLMAYSGYLWLEFNDPLFFMHVQDTFGTGRSTTQLTILPQVFWRYGKMILSIDWRSWTFYVLILELSATLVAIWTSIILWRRKLWTLALYSTFITIVPTLTGTLNSMPRYIMVIWPIYFLLAEIKGWKYLLMIILIGSLLLVNLIRFTTGGWIS